MLYQFCGVIISWFLMAFPVHSEIPVSGDNVAASNITEKVVVGFDFVQKQQFLNSEALYREGWDQLPNARFWRQVIRLHHDSAIVNIARKREPLLTISTEQWACQTEPEKDDYKANLCRNVNVSDEEMLYVTSGKKFFFEYKKAMPFISRSIAVFEAEQTDPWYAQAILLIESPGKTTASSYVGARGPFQLMPSVARSYGLTVNKYHDDRTDLEKSAKAAAALLKQICIPKACVLMDTLGVTYNTTDIWFRLLVLHIYHAGFGNVSCAVRSLDSTSGGMDMIRQLWVTECRGFKNESQNYTQIAIASMLEFDEMINQDKDTVFLVSGDRMWSHTETKSYDRSQLEQWYLNLKSAYENDLVNGVIPAAYFIKKTWDIDSKLSVLANVPKGETLSRTDLESVERLNEVGNELMRKRKFNEAIEVLKAGLEKDPKSYIVYDSLGKVYKLMGDKEMARKYEQVSQKLIQPQ